VPGQQGTTPLCPDHHLQLAPRPAAPTTAAALDGGQAPLHVGPGPASDPAAEGSTWSERSSRNRPASDEKWLTAHGLHHAMLITDLHTRVLQPGLAQLCDPDPPAPTVS
jgi:hypothetical protein